jgi:hypothetical protein
MIMRNLRLRKWKTKKLNQMKKLKMKKQWIPIKRKTLRRKKKLRENNPR